MEASISESKYSFPPHDTNSNMSYKLSQTDRTSSLTPSPPIPSPTTEPFTSRSLAPLEPQHSAIPSYLTAQRRGSITDPSLHLSVPNPELARQYSQPDINFPSTSTVSSERRGSFVTDQYPSSPSSRPSSVKSEQSFSPLETRKLRDALPSISASASPIKDGFPGPLMNPAFQAQLQPRRHSIAVGEVVSPLKRKNVINVPVPPPSHPMNPDDYSVKRQESVGDPNIQRLSLYDRRSSYSAPSSPPAPPTSSFIPSNSPLPKLNVQDINTSLQSHAESCSIHPQYNDSISDHSVSQIHLSEQNDPSLAYPPFSNPRLSQIVQEEVSAPILASRASMPVMTFPSRFSDPIQQESTIPMDVDRYRTQVYQPHHHSYHPYAYDYLGYIQQPTPVKETPYSRSPELRISHKLAERKRRKEMKELFDELRDSLPVDKSLKTSKWEILSKGEDFFLISPLKSFPH